MARALQFRHRIGLLVALAAIGLAAVTITTLLLGWRVDTQMAAIETRYVPLLVLDRDLEAMSLRLTRALEDAAAAAERSRLEDADELVARMYERVRAGAAVIGANGGDAAVLEAQLRVYFTRARGVAEALIADTHASALEAEIEEMNTARETFRTTLDTATQPDRDALAAAFAKARTSQRDALRVELLVAASALAAMMLLSWRLTRRTVRGLHEVSRGVEKLAAGDFAHEIVVDNTDEIGALAREANRTAVRLRDYRDTLEARAEELARASKYKSEFLANMSHELRTPLNSILILSQVLSENAGKRLTPKEVEFASVIRNAGEELLALVNEVLDLSKVEAGKQTFAFAPVEVPAVADYVRRMFQPVADQKQLALDIQMGEDLPAKILTDWSRLAQILKNLLANAFKFTAQGGVTVRIARVAGDNVSIAVTDTGIGIGEDKQRWIFDAFAQVESGTSRKYGGTGLGLTIARELALRLGGSLTVTSSLGAGATFTLVLPVDGPPDAEDSSQTSEVIAAPVAAVPATPSTVSLDGRTVLLADDDMRALYALSSLLVGEQLRIVTATDGQEALDELGRHDHVDLILLDASLPVLSAPDAIRAIRSRPRFSTTPIVSLAATAEEATRCREAGATAHVDKPVELGQLRDVLASVLTPPASPEA